MKICELLKALINVAEKGANIARIIRSEQSLLELLVQEKTGNQKNEKFVQDFKTLADVLVQEVVRYDLCQKFPGIGPSIYGEESNKFTNKLGDSVIVEIQHTAEATKALLGTVLDDNEAASHILADVIHQDVNVYTDIDHLDQNVFVDDIGVWIDPIDSTAQYIHGEMGVESGGLVTEGLQCASVLIGVYSKTTGEPIIGVINQPFCKLEAETGIWTGNTTWGVCVGDVRANSLTSSLISSRKATNPIILLSSSESPAVLEELKKQFTLYHIAGAGYKLLGVCQGLADAYVLTKSSNYKWDCCGPHAILRSLGGGVIKYADVYKSLKDNGGDCDLTNFMQIKYHIPDQPDLTGAQKWCNDGGIIAFCSQDILKDIGKSIVNL